MLTCLLIVLILGAWSDGAPTQQLELQGSMKRSISTDDEPTDNNDNQPQRGLQYNLLALGLRPSECNHDYGMGVRMYTCASHTIGDANDWPCVRAIDLCNGVPDCPKQEDEHPSLCMFHLAERDLLRDVSKAVNRMTGLIDGGGNSRLITDVGDTREVILPRVSTMNEQPYSAEEEPELSF